MCLCNDSNVGYVNTFSYENIYKFLFVYSRRGTSSLSLHWCRMCSVGLHVHYSASFSVCVPQILNITLRCDSPIICFEVFMAVTAQSVVFWFEMLTILKTDNDLSKEHVFHTFGVEVCAAVPVAMTALEWAIISLLAKLWCTARGLHSSYLSHLWRKESCMIGLFLWQSKVAMNCLWVWRSKAHPAFCQMSQLRSELEADHSTTYSAYVKICGVMPSVPICLHGVVLKYLSTRTV